jgi:ATP-binding cassette, subfamily F, member 3
MENKEVVIRFDKVSFNYGDKVILKDADFSVRKNSKITIMGQNGAGKSTIFKLIQRKLKPDKGNIFINENLKIGIAEQMVPREKLELSIKEYFETAFEEKVYDIDKRIHNVLDVVHLEVPLTKLVKDLSGGQKSRLLLAHALIQNPDILLLDEPTNNLDIVGISHLILFLMEYPKTVSGISHEADFLNSFTDGVLNLDVHTKKVDQFVGDYYSVVQEIAAEIERQRLLNSRIEKSIRDRFEKVNKLGGKSVAMRKLANKVRADIEDDREKMVDVRREDKTIPEFTIPAQHTPGEVMAINSVEVLKGGEPTTKKVEYHLFRGDRLIIKGPNGIGKSTLLKAFLAGKGVKIAENVKVGYYSQDFSELNFNDTAFNALLEVMDEMDKSKMFAAAGRFMLSGEMLENKVESLSDGQKGLLCYARFLLQEPGILIMDEPSNHINFRHLPVIAKALNEYKGVLIIVSHNEEFISKIKINLELDLESI